MTEMDITVPKDVATLEDATKFAEENAVDAVDGSMCVDGRYEDQDIGKTARPGADAGDVETLLLLKQAGRLSGLTEEELTPEALTDRVIRAVNSLGLDFIAHTDTHENPEIPHSIGCGHLAKAADPATSQPYGVKPEDMQRVIVYLKKRQAEGAGVKISELEGPHNESGVLIITGTAKTIKHSAGGRRFFVWDKERDARYQERLVGALNIPELSVNEFRAAAEIQRNATLGFLAKGLPIFEANVDHPVVQVQSAGIIQ